MADIITTGNRSGWKTEARVRLLGSDDSATLPDATLSVFLDEVERSIKAKVTDWASLTGNDKEYLITAAICLLCSKLAPTMPILVPKIEKATDFSETREIDWKDVEARLISEADVFVSDISTYTPVVVTRAAVISPSTAMWEDLDLEL